MKNKLLVIFPFSLVIILAILLRTYQLYSAPPSLNWDEASHGYNAYALSITGKDEWGHWFPTIFRAFGDFKLPAYIYMLVPIIAIFGLNEITVKSVSILSGIGSVIYTFLFVRQLLINLDKSNKYFPINLTASLASLSLAISPWSVFLSRVAVEANLSSFLIISGAYYFILGIYQKKLLKPKAWGFALSGLLFGIGLFSYNSSRIFIPFLITALIVIYKKTIFEKLPAHICHCHLVGFAIYLFFFTGMVYQLLSPVGQARFDNIQIINQGAINKINENRGASNLPDPLPRIIHNKVTFFAYQYVKNYFSFYNPQFLFITGGDHYQFSVQQHGLMYLIELPFYIAGVFFLFKLSKTTRYTLLAWFLLAPIAASTTRDNPHTLRIITMIPIPHILTALGITGFYTILKSKPLNFKLLPNALISIYVVIILYSTFNYWTQYTKEYIYTYAWAWQPGSKQIVNYVKQNYSKYNEIYVTKKYGEPHIFFAFFWPWNPTEYQEQKLSEYHDNWYWVNQLGRIKFFDDYNIEDQVICNQSCLLITSPRNIPQGEWTKLETINSVDNTPIFEIYTSKQFTARSKI